jgi:hypothetical protein
VTLSADLTAPVTAHPGRLDRALTPLRCWLALAAWTAGWAFVHKVDPASSWHYFATGGTLLTGDDKGQGLELYAAHPDLQIGPLTFVVAIVLRYLNPPTGHLAGLILMTALGPILLNAVWRLIPEERRRPTRLLTAGLVFIPVWVELSTHAGHLDDVLALGCAVLALHAFVRNRPLATGLLLAAAVDCKPWAAAFAPLVLGFPGLRKLPAAAGLGAGVAVAWLPFLLYDPHTMAAARFTIPNAAASALRVLGVTSSRTPPWDRAAQLVLGCALGTMAIIRGRWPAIILLGTAARILLDPQVYTYYTSGVLLGAVVFDLLATRRTWPVATITGYVLLYFVRSGNGIVELSAHTQGILRVTYVVSAVAMVLLYRRSSLLSNAA